MRLFNVIDLPEFLGCQFQLKVTILQIGFQPCPTFIRVNKCALVRPKIIQQFAGSGNGWEGGGTLV